MATTGPTTGDKLKVFVSYARRDVEFADQLVAVLEAQGFQIFIDRKGIYGAERWEERLGQLILQSDTVVFVLSPDSAESPVCAWEVEEAARRGKRIIPVLCRPLDGKQPPARLRDLNYIYLYPDKSMPGSGWGTGQVRLIEALSVDIVWLREHTRLEELAARWQASHRHADSLLRGSELAACKAWRDRRPANAPELTDLQRAFLGASEEEETARASAEHKRLDEMAAAQYARQKAIEEREAAVKREAEAQKARARSRRIIAWGSAAAAALLILGVAGFAYQQALNLRKQEELTTLAVRRAEEAALKTYEAEVNLRKGQITESYFRAEQAKAAGADTLTAALLALEGMRDEASDDGLQRTRPFVNEAWHELYSARVRQRERKTLTGHTDRVRNAVFSPDGRRILTASADETARLWDADGKPLATLQGHIGTVTSAVFSPDGRRILTASDDKTARLWDGDGKPLATLQGHIDVVRSAAFSPDGRRILTASADNTARLWDADGKPLAILQGHTGTVTSAVFSPDGRRILTASDDNTAWLWDGGGKPLATFHGHTAGVLSAVFSADGRRILTASFDNTARLWDADGKPLATLQGHTDTVRSAVFSPDRSAVFSPDGRRILTASDDHTARLWETDGKPLATLQGHTGPVRSAVFSPDGRRILTASSDKTARLSDGDGKLLATLQGHTGGVHSAVFSPDGRHILTASDDHTARLWDAFPNPQELVDLAKAEVPRCLTPEQRRVLFLPSEPPRWCYTMHKWPYDAGSSAAQAAASGQP